MFAMETKSVTCWLRLFLFSLFFVCLLAFPLYAATITTITVKEMDGVSTANYPLTFGMVFKEGDVTGNVYLGSYATQTDVKTTWADGSIRHAVISALVPMTANSDTVLNLNTTGTSASTTPMTQTEILATDVGATIDISNLADSGYSGSLTANLRTAISNETTLNYWLEGGVCTEILVDQRLNNSLNATWEVRFYPDTSYIRISHAMENVEANYRGNIQYDYSISQGHASPVVVKPTDSINHIIHSRWRKVYWLGSAPPEVEIHYDIDYLIETKMIPSYDTSIVLNETAISSWSTNWNSYPTEPYDTHDSGGSTKAGFATVYWPATGGRPELGVLPQWQAMYLLSFDNRMKKIMLGQAELFANAPFHYRESDSSKSFYGHIISIDDRPSVQTNKEEYFDDTFPAPIGTTDTTPWVIDTAHQCSADYIPYMLTGEKFYLDEMYYLAGKDLNGIWYADNDTWGRNYSEGLLRGQIRAEGWMFRALVQAAAIAPDGDIEATYFEDKIQNNIDQWEIDVVRYPLRQWESNSGYTTDLTSSVITGTSAWMDDYVSLILNHAKDLGYDTTAILDEQQKFQIGRFSQPGFNWFLGAEYRFPVETDSGYVSDWDINSLFENSPTSFSINNIVYDFEDIALAAVSQLTNYQNGQAAYTWLLNNVPERELWKDDPTWGFVPRGLKPPTGLSLE